MVTSESDETAPRKRTILRIENAAAAKAQFFDRFGVNDTSVDRHERADRRRVAKAAWSVSLAAMRKIQLARTSGIEAPSTDQAAS